MTPPRDLVAANGKRDAVICRGCGKELGKLNCSHTIFIIDHQATKAYLVLGTTRIELVCRSCGSCRYLRGDRLARMTFLERIG